MMIAHTTIVMARYMMLGIEQRRATDPRSLGNLFEDYCDNMISAKFGKALRLLLTQLASAVQTIAAELGAFFENLITQFIGQLPRILRDCLQS